MNSSEKKIVSLMISVYCSAKHSSPKGRLCHSCSELEAYAHQRLQKCIYGEDKPTCKQCPVHCYKPSMKVQMQEVMRFSGPRMILVHPIAAIKHLLKELRPKKVKRSH
ncbi:hypothetical protein M2132_001126 [Dysgonomonas sp. PH5-45]|uniref:nitrous oxide-stimulated promoter family protein n=1 Tax=unclassified Dysgonomonas TaxID=2630389 RepID=UPI00247447BE|nr:MULTISPECIES: nitrous oxide-stimulated promoter family protein [unclassified Dysgonomonas]MDH6354795.1 hypothetical protein [Dysgonomonas sp. PH5-45]MDH6387694.1 hypothetical protein [Dysgonomonas sp. PH5-37]